MTFKEFLKANRNNLTLNTLVDQAERQREIDEDIALENYQSKGSAQGK